jgi:hypothetical protein
MRVFARLRCVSPQFLAPNYGQVRTWGCGGRGYESAGTVISIVPTPHRKSQKGCTPAPPRGPKTDRSCHAVPRCIPLYPLPHNGLAWATAAAFPGFGVCWMHWPPFSPSTNSTDRKGAHHASAHMQAWVSWSYGLRGLCIACRSPPSDIFFPLSHKALAPVPNLICTLPLNRVCSPVMFNGHGATR